MKKQYYLNMTGKDHGLINGLSEKAGITMKEAFIQGAKEYLQKKLKIDNILEKELKSINGWIKISEFPKDETHSSFTILTDKDRVFIIMFGPSGWEALERTMWKTDDGNNQYGFGFTPIKKTIFDDEKILYFIKNPN